MILHASAYEYTTNTYSSMGTATVRKIRKILVLSKFLREGKKNIDIIKDHSFDKNPTGSQIVE